VRIFHDFFCAACDWSESDWPFVHGEESTYPPCPEGLGLMAIDHSSTRIRVDIWGQSRTVEALGGTFASKDDARREAKRLGLEPAGDLVGGARTMITSEPEAPVDKATRSRYASYGPEAA